MSRSRYLIKEPERPHFLTCTVLEWLPVFTRPEAARIILDSWSYLRLESGLKLYGYVILENHLHFVACSRNLNRDLHRFKSYTARKILDHLQEIKHTGFLKHLQTFKDQHKIDREYQLWQEDSHPEMIMNEDMLRQKLDYIHANPIKRGYVDLPEHWRYSSARNYAWHEGVIEIDCWWE